MQVQNRGARVRNRRQGGSGREEEVQNWRRLDFGLREDGRRWSSAVQIGAEGGRLSPVEFYGRKSSWCAGVDGLLGVEKKTVGEAKAGRVLWFEAVMDGGWWIGKRMMVPALGVTVDMTGGRREGKVEDSGGKGIWLRIRILAVICRREYG